MSNEGILPSKLKKHFTTKHSHLQCKDLNYFQRLLEQQSKQRNYFERRMNASEKVQVASIEVAETIELKTKSHTESIILPACRKIVKTMLGDEAEQEINKIPLSNNIIHRKIMDLSADIEEHVQNKLQNSKFALQVDESTDISNKTQLLTFIRFIDGNQITHQFFCCEEMPSLQEVKIFLTFYLPTQKR
ncbi:zinc finger BED domain-containing protein 5 [Octopus bimaculoides]|uniref:zinc finger BED domain-containing protein 5 n=1 Tax=Octopus bimaculoides TaxID=37653 RepID=UPI00071D2221|nr:zinc finger BED domain-containing protein 5 [Octopus bimaculoides]|eukprot:XP_014779908.1 PREDICTED: zinc finger BED domain-containing protein 5-like [Octopus bimaculoides]